MKKFFRWGRNVTQISAERRKDLLDSIKEQISTWHDELDQLKDNKNTFFDLCDVAREQKLKEYHDAARLLQQFCDQAILAANWVAEAKDDPLLFEIIKDRIKNNIQVGLACINY